jgi:hypothetical protein
MSSKPLVISDQHLLDQIQAGLTRQVNGRQTVTIKLWPEHLGRVDVKLVMQKQNLTAIFTVENPEVKNKLKNLGLKFEDDDRKIILSENKRNRNKSIELLLNIILGENTITADGKKIVNSKNPVIIGGVSNE